LTFLQPLIIIFYKIISRIMKNNFVRVGSIFMSRDFNHKKYDLMFRKSICYNNSLIPKHPTIIDRYTG